MYAYPLAGTELATSALAYGCMHLSRAWDASPLTAEEHARTQAVVETALEQGITLFDHADIYARGKSERLFGEFLGKNPRLRERMVIQSKCGIRFVDDPVPGVPGRYDFSHGHLVGSVEGSLQRLGIEYLDILLLHRPDALCEPEEVARAFDHLQRSGKVRHFGVSNHTAGQIALLQHYVDQPLRVNQVEISLLHPHLINEGVIADTVGSPYAAAAGTLDHCRLHDIRLQAWSPLGNGRLAGDVAPQWQALAAGVAALARQHEVSAEAILLAWLLRHPAGLQPIVGTTDPGRLAAACQSMDVQMSREDWYRLFTLARGAPVP